MARGGLVPRLEVVWTDLPFVAAVLPRLELRVASSVFVFPPLRLSPFFFFFFSKRSPGATLYRFEPRIEPEYSIPPQAGFKLSDPMGRYSEENLPYLGLEPGPFQCRHQTSLTSRPLGDYQRVFINQSIAEHTAFIRIFICTHYTVPHNHSNTSRHFLPHFPPPIPNQ